MWREVPVCVRGRGVRTSHVGGGGGGGACVCEREGN